MRKPVLAPSFNHYLGQLSQNDELLVTVLKGHLVIEALLVELIQLKISNDQPWRWNFLQKIDWCVKEGYISAQKGVALKAFNDIRNDFAHVLGHQLAFDQVFTVAQQLGEAGFDFSDKTIYTDRELSKHEYGIDGAIIDILNTIFFDLAFTLMENGGHDHSG